MEQDVTTPLILAEIAIKPRFNRWWWLLPLLLLFFTPLLFFKACLNSGFVHHQIALYAEQEGISIAYGAVTDFAWWRGISLDRIELEKDETVLVLTNIFYLFAGDLHVAKADLSIDERLLATDKNASLETLSIDPSLLALFPKHVYFETIHIEASQMRYKGVLELTVHAKEQAIDAILQGQWGYDDDHERFTGSVQTAFRLTLSSAQLNVAQLLIKNATSEISMHDMQIKDLLTQPHLSIANAVIRSDIEPFAGLFSKAAPQLSHFQHIYLDVDGVRYADNTLDLVLKKMLMKTVGGGVIEVSGSVKWAMQNQVSRIESHALSVLVSLPNPHLWGIPTHEKSHINAHLSAALSLDQRGGLILHQLNMKSMIKLGNQQWQADVITKSVRFDERKVMLDRADVTLTGERAIIISGQQFRAGKYRLLLSHSKFDFSDVKRLIWQVDGDIDMAIQGVPELTLHVNSTGLRKPDRTLLKALEINLNDGAVKAVVHGSLHDRGLAHRSSRLQGSLSMGNIAELRRWVDIVPNMEGRVALKWQSEGHGMDKLFIHGRLKLSALHMNQAGLKLQGGELVLPFRQLLNLTDMSVKKGRAMNHADLSRIAKLSLPGLLTIKSLAMGDFELIDSRIGLLLDGDVVMGKVEQGTLLNGNMSGYFQLSMPDKKQRYPDLFARLSLLHADSAQFNSQWHAQPSRFNLYATIKNDGGNLSGRLSLPDIRRKSLDHLIRWLDPETKNAALQNVKQMMEKYGYAPSSTDARLQNQYADIDVVLKSRGGDKVHIPIHNLSVGHLIGE